MSNIAPSCPSLAARCDPHLTRSSSSIRDYILEGDDGTMRQAMSHIADEEDTIRMHNEALQAIEDAALARALALSEETALREARRRVRRSGAHIPSTTLRQILPEPTNAPVTFPSKAHATGSSAEARTNPESNQAAPRANIEPISINATNEIPQVSNATSSDDAHILSALVANRADSCSREKSPRRASPPWPPEQSGLSSQNNVIDDPNILAQNGFSATNDGSDFSQELFSNVRFFAPPRKCCHCDEYIERVHNSVRSSGIAFEASALTSAIRRPSWVYMQSALFARGGIVADALD